MEPTLAVYLENSPVEALDQLINADPAPSQTAFSPWTGALAADATAQTSVVKWSKAHHTRVIAVYFDDQTFEFQLASQGQLVRHLLFCKGQWEHVKGEAQPWEAPTFCAWYKLIDELQPQAATNAALIRLAQAAQTDGLVEGRTVPQCVPVEAMLAVAAWYGLEKPD